MVVMDLAELVLSRFSVGESDPGRDPGKWEKLGLLVGGQGGPGASFSQRHGLSRHQAPLFRGFVVGGEKGLELGWGRSIIFITPSPENPTKKLFQKLIHHRLVMFTIVRN
jgi:hypothetical protein